MESLWVSRRNIKENPGLAVLPGARKGEVYFLNAGLAVRVQCVGLRT